jgi:glycosyltransferase involved in cell wall biosynthesis
MNICILSSVEDSMQKDTGASVRIYNLAKGLVECGNDVTIVVPKLHPTFEIVDGVKVRGFSGLFPKLVLDVLKRFVDIGRPTALYFYDLLFALRIIPLLKESDVIQIEGQTTGGLIIPLIKLFLKKPLILDCHDVFQALRLKQTRIVRRMLETSLEKLAYKYANLILVVSENERNFLASMGTQNCGMIVVPNGVDTQIFIKSPNRSELKIKYNTKNSRVVVFVGNLAYPPNHEAVTLLSTFIAPIVFRQIKNVKFVIVGKKQSDLKSPQLSFTGFVDNVPDVLSISDVAVAPLLHGSGTRLKILEYFSCGLPVVSTSVGAEGLDVEDGVNILIEDNLERFAMRIVELLTDPLLSNDIGNAGRKLAATTYDWKIITKELNGTLANSFLK